MSTPFLLYPHKILKREATPVEHINDEVKHIWAKMIHAMDDMPGVGLAAPQIGIPLALAVVDASEERGQAIRMANPRILHASAKLRTHEEASPNLPYVSAKVERPRAVTVEFLNQDGQRETVDLIGLWATSVQHQIDHLCGKLFIDRLSKLKRGMLVKKSRKLSNL